MASPVLYCLVGCRNPCVYRGSRRFSSAVPTVPVRSGTGTLHYRSLASCSTGPASPQVASEAAFYIRGAAPWPRLSSTASSAVETRASTADPGVFLQQYLRYAPVLYIPQPRLVSTDLATPPQPRRPLQPWPHTAASSPHPSLHGFSHQEGPRRLSSSQNSTSLLHQVNFLFRSGQTF